MAALEATLTAPPSPVRADERVFAVGSQVAGRYRVIRFIAAGGTSEVYEVEDLVVGTRIALKALKVGGSATAIARLQREIALARRVTHRNVCRMYDVGEHAGRPFLTMELLAGETLSARLQRGPLSSTELERIARQLVAGLAALHAQQIVHRDFKSSNVILTGSGERVCAVVTDFGLARRLDVEGGSKLTVTGGMLGTPAYMAPEQVEGQPATVASDIYSLGVVLFEMATGRLPFHESTSLATATVRLTHRAPRARELNKQVSALVDIAIARCLERDPALRPSSVLEVLAPPRRRSWRPIARGFMFLVTIAALVQAATSARHFAPHAAGSASCPSGESKLIGIGDIATRTRIASRFAHQPEWVRVTWQSHAVQLDELARQWRDGWDVACKANDATTDPLLHGQRLSCLESSLLELRAFATFFGDDAVDPKEFAISSQGGLVWLMPPSACASEPFLRGQVALPPPQARPAIDALMTEFFRQRWVIRLATTNSTTTDRDAALANLDALETRSLDLHYPTGAAEIEFWHGLFLTWFGRNAEADAKAARVIELAESTRDDAHLVLGHVLHVWSHQGMIDYDAADAESALEQASRAAARLGNPPHLVEWLEQTRVGHLERVHRPGLDVRERVAEIRLELGRPMMALWERVDLVGVRTWTEGANAQLAEARTIIADSERVSGAASLQFSESLRAMSMVFAQAGDTATALRLVERAIAIDEPAMPAHQENEVWFGHVFAAGYAANLGASDASEAHVRAAVRGAMDGGASELGSHAVIARVLRQWGFRRAAELALRLARRVPGNPTDAASIADEERALAAELGEPVTGITDPHQAAVMHARDLVRRGTPKQALALLQRLRGELAASTTWGSYELAEVETWLGIALLQANDAASARGHLEEALWLHGSCCVATSLLAQDARLALAQSLYATGGDHARARLLASLARTALVRMGPALDAQAQVAARWLATHPD